MKPRIYYFSFVTLATIFVGAGIQADEVINSESIEITFQQSRALIKKYQFSSYPPQKYKGGTLVKVRKNKGGYLGSYC